LGERESKIEGHEEKTGFRYLFGPVPSRRLGLSLGVDLFPAKVCNFNCPYCECGWTQRMPTEREEFVPFEDVAEELRRFLPNDKLDFITFSGNGEPTLYSRLGDLIRLIRSLTGTRIAVITNSSLAMRADVRAELAGADVVMPSLDAVSQNVMRRINHSHKSILAKDMIEGLVRLRDEFRGEMRLEILFCKGINDSPGEVALLAEAAKRIRPDLVQLNTVDRPPADAKVKPLSRGELERIRDAFDMRNVEIIGAFQSQKEGGETSAMTTEDQILSLISRRGVYETDLILSLDMPGDKARLVLDELVNKGKIRRVDFEGRPHFFRI
jgi:wyosine [tRNA(Phe)-imidazoG37] synthetase (radical SAM superfamily)